MKFAYLFEEKQMQIVAKTFNLFEEKQLQMVSWYCIFWRWEIYRYDSLLQHTKWVRWRRKEKVQAWWEQKKKVFCVYESTLCVLCICLVLGRFGTVGLVDSTVASLRTWRICWCCFCYCTRKEGEEEWTGWLAGYDLVVAENQVDKKSSQAVVSWVPFVLLLVVVVVVVPFPFCLVESSSIRTFLLHQQ